MTVTTAVQIPMAAVALTSDVIGTWAAMNAPSDDQYWAPSGEWVAGLPLGSGKAGYRQGGPAVACAAAHRMDGGANPYFRPIAEKSIDWALSPAGRSAIGFGTDAIETMMFCQDLGTTILLLDGRTDPGKIAAWKVSLREGVDRVLLDVDWYANGNINLGYALVVYLAGRVLQDPKYDWRAVFEKALHPVQHSGGDPLRPYGLVVESSPGWPTGYDGAAFLTEQAKPGWTVGYDGEYTMVQLDVLTRLACLSGAPDVALLASQVLNKTLERTELDSWTVHCGGGTRHMAPDWDRVLMCPTPCVLESLGERKVPESVLVSHWNRVEAEFRSDPILKRPNVNFYKGLGGWVGVVLLNRLVESGVVAGY